MRKIWRNYGLGITLFALFALTWLGQGLFQWQTYKQEQEEHGKEVMVSEYLDDFGQSTLENWQSEFLQLFTMVALTSVLSFKGSPESKDGDEKKEKMLKEILSKLERLDAKKNRA